MARRHLANLPLAPRVMALKFFSPGVKWKQRVRLIRTDSGYLVREGNCIPLNYTHMYTHAHMVLGIHCCGLWIQSIDSIFHQLDQELSAQYWLALFHLYTISIPLPISPMANIHWSTFMCGFISSAHNSFIWSLSLDLIFIWPHILALTEDF